MLLPFVPVIPFLGIWPKEVILNTGQKTCFTGTSVVALCMLALGGTAALSGGGGRSGDETRGVEHWTAPKMVAPKTGWACAAALHGKRQVTELYGPSKSEVLKSNTGGLPGARERS